MCVAVCAHLYYFFFHMYKRKMSGLVWSFPLCWVSNCYDDFHLWTHRLPAEWGQLQRLVDFIHLLTYAGTL